MDGFHFATDVRVRFAETDAQGIVHNANYLVWFELARVAYLEEFAGGYPKLREQGIEALVLESHVRYREPARFDDRLRVHARCGDLRDRARCSAPRALAPRHRRPTSCD